MKRLAQYGFIALLRIAICARLTPLAKSLPGGLLVLAVVLAVLPPPAHAWGALGHRNLGALSYALLQPAARARVDQLLALEPGATLASVSTWADEQVSPATSRWHYVNLPRGDCHYDAARDCPGGQCVVQAIHAQLAVLRDGTAEPALQLQALKYLVHFMQDLHQPLHAGHADDRGGNRYQLSDDGMGSNLHLLWDVGLVQRLLDQQPDALKRMSRRPLDALSAVLAPEAIAEESCRIVARPDFYPPHKLESSYVRSYLPELQERLGLAAQRLAGVLNRLWP